MDAQNAMSRLISLCKRRGFVFQSSEIYGGLKSAYDYGPLGVELKRNIASIWWRDMVSKRENVYGLDASIMMHPKVWQASGHLDNFSDPLVDCLNCKERFRADKVTKQTPGTAIEYVDYSSGKKGKMLPGVVPEAGYCCPNCNSPHLSPERQFHGMFKTTMGAVDPMGDFIEHVQNKSLSKEELRAKLAKLMERSTAYLRPETAQAMFVQFLNVQQTMSAKIPFGIAQIGKSFRNEIIVEHYIFRSCEFEQMEMEFFCEPGEEGKWLEYWKQERLGWYRKYANSGDKFRLREHAADELAHYSNGCFDVEYRYPWGWDELEGIASRTDYDLRQHAAASGAKLSYFDQQKQDPKTGKQGWRYVPYVIEPAAGLTRSVLAFLLDAYTVEELSDGKGGTKTRDVLKIHPQLAPYKVSALPLVRKDGQPELAAALAEDCRNSGLPGTCDMNQSIGKRYAKHDEIGTPFCVTVDGQTAEDGKVTVRDRDSTEQVRMDSTRVVAYLHERLDKSLTE
ncbi:MAG: glycine--tRNA ligase [Zetaproteobacteria bacterium]|nr:glycine--tRNA ligase [Zetaproteobacteria bacterium]